MTRARDVASQGGLVLISSTNFSAVATASINNCFSATYENYKVIFDESAQSSTSNVSLRMRNAGADRTGAVYFNSSQGLTYLGATAHFNSLTSNGVINVGFTGIGSQSKNSLEFFHPFDATQPTVINGNANGTTGVGSPFQSNTGIMYQAMDSNDGFTIYPDAGTISGTIRIYGIRN